MGSEMCIRDSNRVVLLEEAMETHKGETTGNVAISEGIRVDSEGLRIEFVSVHDEKDNDLALAMNCSNG